MTIAQHVLGGPAQFLNGPWNVFARSALIVRVVAHVDLCSGRSGAHAQFDQLRAGRRYEKALTALS